MTTQLNQFDIYGKFEVLSVIDNNDILSLNEIKEYLRLNINDTDEDVFLQSIRDAAINDLENYLNTYLVDKQAKLYLYGFHNNIFRTITDPLCSNKLFIRKGYNKSVDLVQYYINETLTTLQNDKYILDNTQNGYGLLLSTEKRFPDYDTLINNTSKPKTVIITFTAGISDLPVNIKPDIKLALLKIIAFLNENRGDCGCDISQLLVKSGSTGLVNKYLSVDYL